MISRAAVLAEARTWEGTPYRDQGRMKGPDGGVDCVGLPLCVATALNIPQAAEILADPVINIYRKFPARLALLTKLQSICRQVPIGQAQPGDILCVMVGSRPQHILILDIDRYVIHAWDGPGDMRVLRHIAKPRWLGAGTTAFQIPGVA